MGRAGRRECAIDSHRETHARTLVTVLLFFSPAEILPLPTAEDAHASLVGCRRTGGVGMCPASMLCDRRSDYLHRTS
jgi:hypothetical protein